MREAKILALHPHPALVPIFDSVPDARPPFVVLGWMGGGDLETYIQAHGPLSMEETATLGLRLSHALEHLHHLGILHRDLKPANVLLDENGDYFLADLGLATVDQAPQLTRTGFIVGTPIYMAPETLNEGVYSPRSDIYSLGTLLLEAFLGRMLLHLASEVDAIQEELRKVPVGKLRTLLRSCLQQDPERRISSAKEVSNWLERILHSPQNSPARSEKNNEVTCTQEVESIARSPASSVSSAQPSFPLGRLRVSLFVGGTLLLAGMGGGFFFLRDQGRSTFSSPPPPTVIRSAHPLEGIGKELERELDWALQSHFDEKLERLASHPGISFLDGYRRAGVAILKRLPKHQRFFLWMEQGGHPEDLPLAIRQDLRRYDTSFSDLGLLPPYAPFLDASPLPDLQPPPEPLRTYLRGLPDLPALFLRPQKGWLGRALLYLNDAIIGYEIAWKGLASRGLAPRFLRSYSHGGFPGVFGKPLGGLVSRLASVGEFPGQMFQQGRFGYRGFLYASLRAIDSDERHLGLAIYLLVKTCDFSFRNLLMGPMLTAHSKQLFGSSGKGYWGPLLQAYVIHSITNYRKRTLFTAGQSTEREIMLLEKALKSLEGSRSQSGELAWSQLLITLEREGREKNREKILSLWEQGRARHVPLLRKRSLQRFQHLQQVLKRVRRKVAD
jgi:serine/threonine protein kinase